MKTAIVSVLAIIVLVLAVLYVAAIRVSSSQRQMIVRCSTNELRFSMTVQHSSPYALVIGVPPASPDEMNFGGDVTFSQSTGTVVRIPFGSDRLVGCNWLPSSNGIRGFILSWSTNNSGEHFSEHLVKGQTYNVRVTFSNMPPEGSALWFSSIKLIGVFSGCSVTDQRSGKR